MDSTQSADLGIGARVLHVDDDRQLLELSNEYLETELPRVQVDMVSEPREALTLLEENTYKCVIADYAMPELNGIELLHAVREKDNELPFILFTGEGSENVAEEAMRAGVTSYMQKQASSEQYKLLAGNIVDAVQKVQHREKEAALSEVYRVTSDTTQTVEERLENILRVSREYLQTEYAMINRISETEMLVEYINGVDDSFDSGMACAVEDSYCRTVVDEDSVLAIYDAEEEGWEFEPVYQRFGLSSYIGSPVTIDGDSYGTLCFLSEDPRKSPFTASEKQFVQIVSQVLSYELTWEEKTRQLQEKNDYLEEMASFVSHDLRNPLTVALGRVDMARSEFGESEHLETITRNLRRMETIIDDVMSVAQEGKVVSLSDREKLELDEIATSAWRFVNTGESTLEIDDQLMIPAERSKLSQLFENLFRNALDHNDPQGLEVYVGSDRQEQFYIEDNGEGVDFDEVSGEGLFELGRTTSKTGTGLGLAIVKRIADAHGWDVAAKEGTHGGLRIEFTNVWSPARPSELAVGAETAQKSDD